MDYEVILTLPAQTQLDHIIDYILSEFKNEQAALNVLNDAEATRVRLSHTAGSLKLCDIPSCTLWVTEQSTLNIIGILCFTE